MFADTFEQKVVPLTERAEAANYIPPSLKYNQEDRDVMPLLMAPEKTALLVVDMQKHFTEPESHVAPPDASEIVVQINKLVDYCRAHNLPVIWIQMTAPKGGDLGMLGKCINQFAPPESVLARGSHEWELCPELHNEPTDLYVTKPKFNAFWESDLEIVLKGLGVESLIFTGIMTDCCVMMTVIDAFHRDYNSIIVVDATGTPFPTKKEALVMMERLGRILTTDETKAELEALAVN